MMNTELEPNRIIVGEELYSAAISVILASAQRELLIFDQDLRFGGFTSPKKYELLRDFLANNINSQLTIILQGGSYFQEKCPRLYSLLVTYGHKMNVCITNDSAKHAKDCFILADGKHYIKRIHIDQARFKYALDDPGTVRQLRTRFAELEEAILDSISTKTLGL